MGPPPKEPTENSDPMPPPQPASPYARACRKLAVDYGVLLISKCLDALHAAHAILARGGLQPQVLNSVDVALQFR